jgi:hypothetical protein
MSEPKIRKKRIPWKDREHLFTPQTITKLEFICTRSCPYRRPFAKCRSKALKHGPVIWIVKDGKPVEFNNLTTKGDQQ